MPNAISVLKEDHRKVEQLFKEFESLGDDAQRRKRTLVDAVVRELSIHAVIEEQFLYPALRRQSDELNEKGLQALEEHHVVKWLVSELEKMPAKHERFDAKMHVLMANVREHVQEEEKDLFVKMRKHLSAQDLDSLGEVLEAAKKVAPTRPHPRAPDTPPGNLLAGAASAVLDRARDMVSGSVRAPQRYMARQASQAGGAKAPRSRSGGGRKPQRSAAKRRSR